MYIVLAANQTRKQCMMIVFTVRIYIHFIFADNVRILSMSQSVALHLNLCSMQF